MKTYFTFRPYKKNRENALIYLFIKGDKKRERINFDVQVLVKDWDKDKQRLFPTSKENQDKNLILDTMNSKVTAVKTIFRLSEKVLTAALLNNE